MRTKRWLYALVGIAAVAVLGYFFWPRDYCRSAKSKYGLILRECPDGKPRQKLEIQGHGLHRGGSGKVSVWATALYTVASADEWQQTSIDRFDVALSLVDAAGKATPIEPAKGWERWHGEHIAEIELPVVPDGDYLLRATVDSRVEEGSVDLPLALYAPAKVQVLTDRPLYEPGNTVRFRAVVLRANDLTPIDGRPGKWVVRDPDGEPLLEEKAPAGEYGVVAGDFPLDRDAPSGTYRAVWLSGDAHGSATFKVEPFTLPRFRVEAAPERPFYRPGDRPTVTGAVIYSSGAPVAGAKITVDWNVYSERWPAPVDWKQGGLPTSATTDSDGRFVLTLPVVPADLQEQARLRAKISAVDPAGDRVESAATLLLSQDGIQVEAIAELGDNGLVDGFNNRLYLRVTTPDGRPLPGAEIQVKRAWAMAEKGIDAALDADSVARIQIDPGPPVNVVIPAPPYRPRPRGAAVERLSATDFLSSGEATMADRIEMDRWLESLAPCAKWVTSGTQNADLLLRVAPNGAIVAADTAAGPRLDNCLLDVVQRRRLAGGRARLLLTRYQVREPDSSKLTPEVVAPLGAPAGLDTLVAEAALDARDCLPAAVEEGALPWAMAWQVAAGSRKPSFDWIREPQRGTVPAALAGCITSRLARGSLAEPAADRLIGVVRYRVELPQRLEEERPQPTIMKGYELLVSAALDGETLGQTRLRMPPGEVPELRLRATPVLAEPGQEVTVELIRGPSFSGDLPEKIQVDHQGDLEEPKVDAKSRTARFTIPKDGKGWYQITSMQARALVFVPTARDLQLSVVPEHPTYAPGAEARLAIQTELDGHGAPAAVGLFGVDQSLDQLASLPGPDQFSSLVPITEMGEDQFTGLDGMRLEAGVIRGPNAAEATILRVSWLPPPTALDAVIDGSAETQFDPIAELTDRFYVVLEELHAQTRIWEERAPPDQLMEPATMAELWNRALDTCKARGQRIDDAFGRRLRLHRLPPDLLELTDPRQVVVVGTRLPEDVENWSDWVRSNKP